MELGGDAGHEQVSNHRGDGVGTARVDATGHEREGQRHAGAPLDELLGGVEGHEPRHGRGAPVAGELEGGAEAVERKEGQHRFGFVLEEVAERRVGTQQPAGEHDALGEDVLEGLLAGGHLDDGRHQAVDLPGADRLEDCRLASGKRPVDRGARHAGLTADVLGGGLGDPPSGEAHEGGLDDPRFGGRRRCRRFDRCRESHG